MASSTTTSVRTDHSRPLRNHLSPLKFYFLVTPLEPAVYAVVAETPVVVVIDLVVVEAANRAQPLLLFEVPYGAIDAARMRTM